MMIPILLGIFTAWILWPKREGPYMSWTEELREYHSKPRDAKNLLEDLGIECEDEA